MILKHLFEPSLAQSSYLVGCAETGEAIVVDPHVDIAQYLDAANSEGLRITAVTETHIHADFVSGARALAQAAGARLYVSGLGGPDWQYTFAGDPDVTLLAHGDVIEIGRLRMETVHTPGHTPEHVMFVLTDTRAADVPLGLFTGDFLFVGDVGRPDLLETAAGVTGTMESSARRLFTSLRTLDRFPDHVLIWPGHGSGSACGKSLGGVPVSSLGYERIANWALRIPDESTFVESVLADQPDPPMYFGEMKRVNKTGPTTWSPEPALHTIPAEDIAAHLTNDTLSVDVRPIDEHGRLPGSIVVPFSRNFSAWAGAVVPATSRLALVADDKATAEAARRALALIGRAKIVGWIPTEVVAQYESASGHLEILDEEETVDGTHTLVDVRTTAEWRAGHLEGAIHVPLARLPERIASLARSTPLLVYCETGARSTVAASALRHLGFSRVATLTGGRSRHAGLS